MFDFATLIRPAKAPRLNATTPQDTGQTWLVSLCNTRPGQPHMLRAGADGVVTAVMFGGNITGATGFVVRGEDVIVAVQADRKSALLRTRLDFTRQDLTWLEGLSDTHGLLDTGDDMYAVSTGNDQIVRLRPDLSVADRVRPFGTTSEDIHHLNDICLHQGEIVFSMFGARSANALRDGAVMGLASRRRHLHRLSDPHSVTSDGEHLYVLNSATGTLYRIGEDGHEKVLSVHGYARGLCVTPQHFVIGVSAPRRKSRVNDTTRQSRLMPDATADSLSRCGLYIVERTTGQHRFVDLSAHASEVYQIAAAPAGGAA